MSTTATGARARTADAFDDVRRRAEVAAACVVVSHAAMGAVFGALLTLTGETTPWALVSLAAAAAGASAMWTAARMPRVEAGRLIERRFPDCRNELITADEVLSGALDIREAAAGRVFSRAVQTLDGIEPRHAVGLVRPVAFAAVSVAASAAAIWLIWRLVFGTWPA